MITIERGECGQGFDITLREPGMGWKPIHTKAKTITECEEAVAHYFAEPSHHLDAPRASCPLCRDTKTIAPLPA